MSVGVVVFGAAEAPVVGVAVPRVEACAATTAVFEDAGREGGWLVFWLLGLEEGEGVGRVWFWRGREKDSREGE